MNERVGDKGQAFIVQTKGFPQRGVEGWQNAAYTDSARDACRMREALRSHPLVTAARVYQRNPQSQTDRLALLTHDMMRRLAARLAVLWRRTGTDDVFLEICRGRLIDAAGVGVRQGEEMIVYLGADGEFHIRAVHEFVGHHERRGNDD